ncbi:interferon alpha-inducible protein 27-like protein 2B isoform X1 [Mizuhopecten yessoensis]|nr:interferon alpha-inducible protein 27-like protein 2B isoform X1 [Mizuhopecten yessoensis]
MRLGTLVLWMIPNLYQRPSIELIQKRTHSNMTDRAKEEEEKRKLRLHRAQAAVMCDKKREKVYKLSELRRAQVILEPDDSDSKEENPPPESSSKGSWTLAKIGLSVLGGVVVVAATPVVLGAVGFASGGIAAGSLAAQLMSAAAVANGGTVAAGSAVAVLQSVGAAGLGLTGAATVGTTAAGATFLGTTAVEKLTEKDK